MRLRALIKLLEDLDIGDIDDVDVYAGSSIDQTGSVTGVWAVTDDSPPRIVLAVPKI